MINKKRKLKIVIFLTISNLFLTFSYIPYIWNLEDYKTNDHNNFDNLKTALDELEGKPLNIHQHANITKTYDDIGFPMNINFDLAPYWTSKNVTINYHGVTNKKDWAANGDLDSDLTGWTYKTNNPVAFTLGGYSGSVGNPSGSAKFRMTGSRLTGDYAYFEQNISISEKFGSGTLRFHTDYYMVWNSDFNGSIFISLIVNNVEKNKTIHLEDAPKISWESLILSYDPVVYGQVLPNTITLRVGVHTWEDDSITPWNEIYFDNIKCELWTKPNSSSIIGVTDNEFSQNYTYINTDFGEGYSFIDVERYTEVSNKITFTVYPNISDVMDFKINNITINSIAYKSFFSEFLGIPGTNIEFGSDITWSTEISISSIPVEYTSWLEVEKPEDWLFTSIIDGYEAPRLNNCSGINYGSTLLEVPHTVLSPGLWKLEAVSKNYIDHAELQFWNGTTYESKSKFTIGDHFSIEIMLNNSISLTSSIMNCSIYYPNSSILWESSKEPMAFNERFGNLTVGKNMTVGDYKVEIIWANNQSNLYIDQIGYKEFYFSIWHHTNLTAVTDYFELIAGNPLLIKVNFLDYDLNESIDFAQITYNTTYGASGMMIYMGLGQYFIDLETNSLSLGDYYLSFNATKTYYANQSIKDMIHIKIISQSLVLEVPHYVINAEANNYATCQLNVTGAISGALIWPVNLSTSWKNIYTITDHSNGTYSLNFSTWALPTQGIIETYSISIFANKTDYGMATNFITITIFPIQAIANANNSIVNVDINEMVDIRLNYTIESSGLMIQGANCTVTWESECSVIPDVYGFIVRLNTTNLSINTYTAIIKLEKAGFETVYKTITIIINRMNIVVNTMGFQDSFEALIGQFIKIQLNLTEPETDNYIENATIFYEWRFGLGYFEYIGSGIYELELKLPEKIGGNYRMDLTISKENSNYKTTEHSFVIIISEDIKPPSNTLFLLILFVLIGIIGILGIISLRTYVILPQKRKRESELLAKTQRYKDVMNIGAILISIRESGLNIYSKSYFSLKIQNEIVSGFIQAITLISDEVIGEENLEGFSAKTLKDLNGIDKIIDLDFKHFSFLICDKKDIRIVFILKEEASERLKAQTAKFLYAMETTFSDKFKNWNGDLHETSKLLPALLNKHLDLYYRDHFKLNTSKEISRIKQEGELSRIESRLLNVIISMTKDKNEFYLKDPISLIHEKKKDVVIEAIESLLERRIVIPSSQ